MKYTYLFLLLLTICFGCKETVSKDQSETVAEVLDVSDTIASESDDELEILDFESFEPLLNKSDDRIYVINFWATWCAPCVKELPYFERLNKEYKSKNVEVILVSLDFPKQYEKKLIPFIEDRKLNSRVIALNDVDFNSWIEKVDESWSGAIPATLIYSKDKRQFFEASFEWEELESELKTFL